MSLETAEERLLEQVRSGRKTRTPLPSEGSSREVDLAGAYRIQAKLAEGRSVKGYKLGLLSPAKQQQMNIDHPTYGRVYPEMIEESPIALRKYMQPRVEPEIAVLLRSDLPADASPGQAVRAVAGYCLAIDILDTVWRDYRFTAAEVVADNTSGGGFVLGSRLVEAPPDGILCLFRDGELIAQGPLTALGEPTTQLAFLANQVGGLRAGQVVFLGSPAAAVPAQQGVLEVVGGDMVLTVKVEE